MFKRKCDEIQFRVEGNVNVIFYVIPFTLRKIKQRHSRPYQEEYIFMDAVIFWVVFVCIRHKFHI